MVSMGDIQGKGAPLPQISGGLGAFHEHAVSLSKKDNAMKLKR
jgi:hypothetical protein